MLATSVSGQVAASFAQATLLSLAESEPPAAPAPPSPTAAEAGVAAGPPAGMANGSIKQEAAEDGGPGTQVKAEAGVDPAVPAAAAAAAGARPPGISEQRARVATQAGLLSACVAAKGLAEQTEQDIVALMKVLVADQARKLALKQQALADMDAVRGHPSPLLPSRPPLCPPPPVPRLPACRW
jgi:hypothetical protein